MPKGTKPAPPQQANLNEFWGKPKSKKKVEEAPVASGSKSKQDAGDMQVDEPSHRDPKSTHASTPVAVDHVAESHSAEVASSPPYGTTHAMRPPLTAHSATDQNPLLPNLRNVK